MPEAPLPPFAALRAFDMVGRAGGIRKAAVALGLSHAIISRHMATLEALLGVPLLNRRTGELTEAGHTYHTHIAAALAGIATATAAMRHRHQGPGIAPELTIWCSPGFSLHWLTRRLPEFPCGGTRPVINLRATDHAPDFERDDADGDIRYHQDAAHPPASHGVRTECLTRPLVFPVAAPALLAHLSAPLMQAADIIHLPLIQESSATEWHGWLAAQHADAPALPPPVARYGQAHLTLAAARAGQGVALTNRFLAAEDLASGRLVRVEPWAGTWQPVMLGAYFFRGSRARWSEPLLARFRRWLARAIAGEEAGKPA